MITGKKENFEDANDTNQSLRQTDRYTEMFELGGQQRYTGLARDQLFEFFSKELIDDALDKTDTIKILVSLSIKKGFIEFSVLDNGKETFTLEDVKKLLDFSKAPSTKRGLKIIIRGILGNALQLMLGRAALEWKHYGDSPEYICQISSGDKTYFVHLEKRRGGIIKRVEPMVRSETDDVSSTEIKFLLPNSFLTTEGVDQIIDIVEHSAWANPHVELTFDLEGTRIADKWPLKDRTDPLSKWKAGTRAGNIHVYSSDEFEELMHQFSATTI
jgi:hypothetical protein